MTKRKIFLLSLIGVLAVTYIFQLIFASRGKITEIKVKGEIAKIEITNKEEKLDLTKNEDSWLISENLPAKAELIQTLSSTLSSIKVIDSIKKNPSPADFEKYGLTSGITVEGYSADSKKLVKLLIGKTSTTGNQTYIQLNDSKEILLVSLNLNDYFSITEKQLLDMTLYTTNANDIYKIAVTYSPSGAFTAEKAGEMADFKWNVIYTPGHTRGCVCFYEVNEKVCFTGDTLFRGTVGRCDLYGGNFGEMKKSVKDRMAEISDDTAIYPGHEMESTMGWERKHNPYLK